jgi:penicillin-binding protein 1A
MKIFLKRALELFFIFIFIIVVSFSGYLTSLHLKNNKIEVTPFVSNKLSKVIDKDGNNVLEIELTRNNNIKFEDLPDVFINALISAEDARFYSHNGIDLQRIISSLVTNVSQGKLQGGSTLTQQLIKKS